MSDELINRRALLDSMDKRYKEKRNIVQDNLAEGFVQMEKLIKEQPAAYNADKVIKRLEERKKYLLKDFVLADKAEEVKERTMARINEIDGLIEIVKSGGVADE